MGSRGPIGSSSVVLNDLLEVFFSLILEPSAHTWCRCSCKVGQPIVYGAPNMPHLPASCPLLSCAALSQGHFAVFNLGSVCSARSWPLSILCQGLFLGLSVPLRCPSDWPSPAMGLFSPYQGLAIHDGLSSSSSFLLGFCRLRHSIHRSSFRPIFLMFSWICPTSSRVVALRLVYSLRVQDLGWGASLSWFMWPLTPPLAKVIIPAGYLMIGRALVLMARILLWPFSWHWNLQPEL